MLFSELSKPAPAFHSTDVWGQPKPCCLHQMKQASSQQQQQAHAVHYSKVDGKAVRPQSAPGQPRYGTLAFDHASATQQVRPHCQAMIRC